MKELLLRAKVEIEDLRQRNESLAAKVEVMDLFACVLHTEPARRSVGEGEDIAWLLQQKWNELDAQEIDEATDA